MQPTTTTTSLNSIASYHHYHNLFRYLWSIFTTNIPSSSPAVTRILYDRGLSIKTARGELYKLSSEVKANLTGIKKLLMITDDPEALLDLSKMKTLLINMFREVDDDNNGYLTFDEFQVRYMVLTSRDTWTVTSLVTPRYVVHL